MDVSKFLCRACPSQVAPELLLDREQVIAFSDSLEGVIKAAGVQQKLSWLALGLDFYQYSMSARDEVSKSAEVQRVKDTLTKLKSSAGISRRRQEKERLADFKPPPVEKFMTSGVVTATHKRTVTTLQALRPVPPSKLGETMLISAGRLLYR